MQALEDETFENLVQNDVALDVWGAIGIELLHYRVEALHHFAGEHYVVVDDGDDAVDGLGLCAGVNA